MIRILVASTSLAIAAAAPQLAAQGKPASGKAVYDRQCAICHNSGVAGAPRFGSASDWSPRMARGMNALYASALEGTPRGMPRRGGNPELSDAEVRTAVDYLLSRVASARPAAPPGDAAAAQAPKAAEPPRAIAVTAAPAAAADAEVNAFNRLLRPMGKRNPPPAEDGIHDPANDGTLSLQPPMQSYASLPKSNSGNRIDWGGALSQKKIQPRWDRNDPKAEPALMDLNIVREVKGSMPDVVYPHRQHTEWLDCSNCHPAIFVPQKGANQISMAAILLGQKCGVCHGKVAFPVSECRLCHSKKKDAPGGPNQSAARPADRP